MEEIDTTRRQEGGARSPVFVHSLFRSGSTYLFDVFRRSPARYWCYQESLHEIVVTARDNPAVLLQFADSVSRDLRHPPLDRPYFAELHETYAAWREHAAKELVYDDAFGAFGTKRRKFLRALVEAARGRPVFQECRTVTRIAAIRGDVGGVHLYLWRNPWDQWRSNQINSYFRAATRLLLSAPGAPMFLASLSDRIKVPPMPELALEDAIRRLASEPLSPADDYFAYFCLWVYAMQAGLREADHSLSIDDLTASPAERERALAELGDLGVDGLSLDDCSCPYRAFDRADRSFFEPIEVEALALAREHGLGGADLDRVASIRERNLARVPAVTVGMSLKSA